MTNYNHNHHHNHNPNSNLNKNLTVTQNHNQHQNHNAQVFLKKFWISFILTIPVILYSDVIEEIFNWSLPDFSGSNYFSLVFSSIVFFYGGLVFLKGAFEELKNRVPGMMTLIAIAISAAYLWSIYAVFFGKETLFWELTTLITIMLLGHWFEMRAVSETQNALKELSKLLPDTAEIIKNEKIQTIPISQLKENDLVLIRPGSKIPADGQVIEGSSFVDESLVTGESKPILKENNDQVIAGTINSNGALKIKVLNIGEKTFLAGVMRLVNEAQASRSRLQILSDKAAFYLTIIAVLGSILTFTIWIISGKPIDFALSRMVAVLVIACPHALGLAIPLVSSISTTKAAQNGFLIKQRLALETAQAINIVLFDKTGTLTWGKFEVTNIWSINNKNENEILQIAASTEVFSEHPIAKAIVNKAQEKNLNLLKIKNFEVLKGLGVKAIIENKEILIGGLSLTENFKIKIPFDFQELVLKTNETGQTVVFVIENKIILGAIALGDLIKEESKQAISLLKEMGLKTAMITGDSGEVAKLVANELKIDEYFARVLPNEKSEKIKELQKRNLKVAMVGDGINDAPALAQADLGIAIGAGTNVAIESASIILVKNDPKDIVKLIKLSKATYNKMIQNLFWATGYNLIALPLAAGALASKEIILDPAISAVFMSLSTIIVAFNALLLQKVKL